MRSMDNRPVAMLGLSMLMTLIVGCGGGGASLAPAATEAAHTAGGGTVEVELTEWAIETDVAQVAVGEVTFRVSNDGAAPHELAVVRADLAADALPTAGGAVDENEVTVVGRVADLGPGETRDGTFTLEAGSYALICNIPAHYELGMRLTFRVE